MGKTVTISIRINEDELAKLKLAAKLESYSTYSEFIRRTSIKEASRIIERDIQKQKGEIDEK